MHTHQTHTPRHTLLQVHIHIRCHHVTILGPHPLLINPHCRATVAAAVMAQLAHRLPPFGCSQSLVTPQSHRSNMNQTQRTPTQISPWLDMAPPKMLQSGGPWGPKQGFREPEPLPVLRPMGPCCAGATRTHDHHTRVSNIAACVW